MKESPILFSGPMVRAIMALKKRMTRRIVNTLRGFGEISQFGKPETIDGFDWHFRDKHGAWNEITNAELLEACPYGKVGDRLWVRETFTDLSNISMGAALAAGPSKLWFYAADGHMLDRGGRWKPSIHMPRKASRLFLEITDLKIERLQDITEEDAIKEGIQPGPEQGLWKGASGGLFQSAAHAFAQLWESLNHERAPWDSNPWVWVISFRLVESDSVGFNPVAHEQAK